jgi:hypothetical protein|tara:strand:+ start:4842 stop:5567 length:726 start_codon:yes stop_codon:yes gene_type:complete
MPLPKIATPTYELAIPSTGKKIKYRPFLVKEEKILILALESEDVKQITNAIKTILKDCISTRGVKVEDLSTFDIEYIFLNIRGKSVGESVDLVVTCPDDEETTVPVKVYIDEIEVQTDPDHSRDIKLDDTLTLRMKYPTLSQFISNNFDFSGNDNDSVEQSFEMIATCMDLVYNDEESWAASDCTKKELTTWIETLNTKQFQEIEKFFTTMPKLSHTIKVTNPNTKVENEVTLEGLQNFFA